MKSIILNTAALTNEGGRCDAGEIVGIGGGKKQIARDRVDELLTLGLASTCDDEVDASGPEAAD